MHHMVIKLAQGPHRREGLTLQGPLLPVVGRPDIQGKLRGGPNLCAPGPRAPPSAFFSERSDIEG